MHPSAVHSLTRLGRIFFVIVLLVLSFASTSKAQPGEGPTIAEVQARYKAQLDDLARQIGSTPANAALHVARAKIYVVMFRSLVLHRNEGRPFLEQAIADFSAAIERQPSAEAHLGRAWCSQTLLWKDPPRDKPPMMVDFFLKSPVYDGFLSEFEHALRLSRNEDERIESLAGLMTLLTWRARNLATPEFMALVRTRGVEYSVWDDLNRALEYARQASALAPTAPVLGSMEGLANVYFLMGEAGYRLAEYDRALTALETGEAYLAENFSGLCAYYALWGRTLAKKGSFAAAIELYSKAMRRSEWNCRYLMELRGDALFAQGKLNEALADYSAFFEGNEKIPGCTGTAFCLARLPIKRAQVYLQRNEPGKAIAEFNVAVEKGYAGHCPQVLLLRAKAFRLTGDNERAAADEQKAAKLEPTQFCQKFYIEGWDE